MAVCAHGLVIVFGTTDLDLLIGKGNNLPVVDVQVPLLWGTGKSIFLCEPCLSALRLRHLDLSEQALSATPSEPEILAAIRESKREGVQNQIERLNLKERSLRHACSAGALLLKADLRATQFQWANLEYALFIVVRGGEDLD